MKHPIQKLFLLIIFFLVAITGFGQTKPYYTSGGEMIFSFANINDQGRNESSAIRWAPVFSPQFMLNKDANKHLGFFTGITIRNVGYIYDHYKTRTTPSVEYKKKFRSYNIGVPVGIKFGDLNNVFVFVGYEVEFPFHYKEKTFDGNDKIEKKTGWFSKRQEWIQHGFMVGVQMKYGLTLKFKYYLSEFHNRDYVSSNGIKPYDGLKSNVFYFSLGSYFALSEPAKAVKNPVTAPSTYSASNKTGQF